MSKKISNEGRSQILSARAKLRKAAIVLGNAHAEGEIALPKAVVDKLRAVDAYLNGLLAVAEPAKARKADTDAEAA